MKSEPPALKARFTRDYLSSQRSFGKWINQPLTSVLSPQAGRGAVLYETFGLESWRTASISMSVTSGIEDQLSGLNRAFGAAFMDDRIPGALPRAKAHTAPLALNTYKRGEARSYIQPWVLSCSSEATFDLNPVKFQASPSTTILLTRLSPTRSVRLLENKCDTARHPASRASNASTPRARR